MYYFVYRILKYCVISSIICSLIFFCIVWVSSIKYAFKNKNYLKGIFMGLGFFSSYFYIDEKVPDSPEKKRLLQIYYCSIICFVFALVLAVIMVVFF